MPVLEEADLAFWRENGYVIARQVITREQAQRTSEALCEYVGMEFERSDSFQTVLD